MLDNNFIQQHLLEQYDIYIIRLDEDGMFENGILLLVSIMNLSCQMRNKMIKKSNFYERLFTVDNLLNRLFQYLSLHCYLCLFGHSIIISIYVGIGFIYLTSYTHYFFGTTFNISRFRIISLSTCISTSLLRFNSITFFWHAAAHLDTLFITYCITSTCITMGTPTGISLTTSTSL